MSVGVHSWRCGKCGTWNKIEHHYCKKCGSDYETWNNGIQYHNKLTSSEEMYYEGTAPNILRELRSIRTLLERLVEVQQGVDDVQFKSRVDSKDGGLDQHIRKIGPVD